MITENSDMFILFISEIFIKKLFKKCFPHFSLGDNFHSDFIWKLCTHFVNNSKIRIRFFLFEVYRIPSGYLFIYIVVDCSLENKLTTLIFYPKKLDKTPIISACNKAHQGLMQTELQTISPISVERFVKFFSFLQWECNI